MIWSKQNRRSQAPTSSDSSPSPASIEKSTRRQSISSVTSILHLANSPRFPLAPLDPQSTQSTLLLSSISQTTADSRPSTASSFITCASFDSDMPKSPIGRHIVTNRGANDKEDGSVSPSKRKAAVSQTPASASEAQKARSSARQGLNAVDAEAGSGSPGGRRTSLPAIHLRPSSSPSSPSTSSPSGHGSSLASSPTDSSNESSSQSPLPHPGSNPAYLTNDDLYKGLSSFSFGDSKSVSPSLSSDSEAEPDSTISPLTPLRKGSVDRTPRPSISLEHGSHPAQGHGRDPPSSSSVAKSATTGAIRTFSKPRPTREQSYGSNSLASISTSFSPSRRIEGSDSDDPSHPAHTATSYNRNRTRAQEPAEDGPGVLSDTASQHTFGGYDAGRRGFSSSSASVDSMGSEGSRPGSRMEFSSDEGEAGYDFVYTVEEEPSTLDHESDEMTPMDFAPQESDIDEEEEYGVGVASKENFYAGRRGSLPMAIPGSAGYSGDPRHSQLGGVLNQAMRDREGSLATLRRPSRSLDDDLRLVNQQAAAAISTGPSTSNIVVVPKSEPLTKGDWETLALQQQQRQTEENDVAYMGFDTSYILEGGMADASGSRRSSVALSYVQPSGRSNDAQRHMSQNRMVWGWPGRKLSTATVGSLSSAGEDTFMKFLKRQDEGYVVRRGEWSFKREMADGHSHEAGNTIPSPRASISERAAVDRPPKEKGKRKVEEYHRGMAVGSQEIWRCEFVGRFKVDRLENIPDPSKPPQQRLQLKHVFDPYSRGNTRGGPQIIVHKHSRAIAFSIYRGHKLGMSNRQSSRGTGVLKSSQAILLAPRRVQEEYTSTRTTAKLNTWGLLENEKEGRSGRHRSAVGRKESDRKERDRAKEKKKQLEEKALQARMKAKKKKEPEPIFNATSSASSYATMDSALTVTNPYPLPASSYRMRRVPSETEVIHASTSPPDSVLMRSSHSSLDYSNRAPSISDDVTLRSSYGDSSDDEHIRSSRTPHSETYATLDSSVIEHVRAKTSPPEQHSNPSFFKRLLRPTPKSTTQSNFAPGAMSASLEGHYQPPWLTMAPRHRQEEKERVIQNLNESFKDVGLLPQARPSQSKKTTRIKSTAKLTIFEQVPEDALYMLLPLWPGETDNASTIESNHATLEIPLMDRQYLLVYYAVSEQQQERQQLKKKEREKKSHKTSHTSSSESTKTVEEHGVLLTEFKICARLVGYEELRGTGIRLPSDGLSVTGSMADAMRNIPPASIRKEHPGNWMIAICTSRSAGMEFVPEGLVKAGLCLPVAPYALEGEDDDPEPDAVLSPIGRAAVEMAWAGCMALTSFA